MASPAVAPAAAAAAPTVAPVPSLQQMAPQAVAAVTVAAPPGPLAQVHAPAAPPACCLDGRAHQTCRHATLPPPRDRPAALPPHHRRRCRRLHSAREHHPPCHQRHRPSQRYRPGQRHPDNRRRSSPRCGASPLILPTCCTTAAAPHFSGGPAAGHSSCGYHAHHTAAFTSRAHHRTIPCPRCSRPPQRCRAGVLPVVRRAGGEQQGTESMQAVRWCRSFPALAGDRLLPPTLLMPAAGLAMTANA